ncbi:hypothetical protein HPB48_003595 [Haemaphysalis longicornis]|uniref:Uncharacterized protein n=1 Tax=Haemaphysalis longicornis TaxID=44386 RepID=A0A9J6FD80_HAELO|nr:hypothetical protein HPB48_003595 [Haemaphysalis longicornis]
MKQRLQMGEHRLRKQQKRQNVEAATADEWSAFLSVCHANGSRPAMLSLEVDCADDFIPVSMKFPSAMLSSMQQDYVPSTWNAVVDYCNQAANNISVEPEVQCFNNTFYFNFITYLLHAFAEQHEARLRSSVRMLLHNVIHFHVYLQVTALVEETTREQAKCRKWFSFKAGQITASNAKAVSRTSTTYPSKSLIVRICYPEENQFWSPQTAWGKQH